MKCKMKATTTKLVCILTMIILLMGLSSCAGKVPSEYIDAINVYKNDLKDPASMRIYGDIIVENFANDSQVISMRCDAKNGYGAYNGKHTIEIMIAPGMDTVYWDSDSSNFLDIANIYETLESLSAEGKKAVLKDSEITFDVVSGKEVAKILGAEYLST